MPIIDGTKLPILARAEKYGCIGNADATRVFFESLTQVEKEDVAKEARSVLEPLAKALQPFVDYITTLEEKIRCQ